MTYPISVLYVIMYHVYWHTTGFH